PQPRCSIRAIARRCRCCSSMPSRATRNSPHLPRRPRASSKGSARWWSCEGCGDEGDIRDQRRTRMIDLNTARLLSEFSPEDFEAAARLVRGEFDSVHDNDDEPVRGNGADPHADFDNDEPAQPVSDLDTRKMTVTFIKDETGAEMRRVDMTLPE